MKLKWFKGTHDWKCKRICLYDISVCWLDTFNELSSGGRSQSSLPSFQNIYPFLWISWLYLAWLINSNLTNIKKFQMKQYSLIYHILRACKIHKKFNFSIKDVFHKWFSLWPIEGFSDFISNYPGWWKTWDNSHTSKSYFNVINKYSCSEPLTFKGQRLRYQSNQKLLHPYQHSKTQVDS